MVKLKTKLYCIHRFSTHKIVSFSKSQPWVYSQNIAKFSNIPKKYIFAATKAADLIRTGLCQFLASERFQLIGKRSIGYVTS